MGGIRDVGRRRVRGYWEKGINGGFRGIGRQVLREVFRGIGRGVQGYWERGLGVLYEFPVFLVVP